jgi:hypothetical protein
MKIEPNIIYNPYYSSVSKCKLVKNSNINPICEYMKYS